MRSTLRLFVSSNFSMPEPIFMKLCMYVLTFESISTAYFIKISPITNTNITASKIAEGKPCYCLNACINLTKLVMYIMPPEANSIVYIINKSHQ
jgi:hypothetical protein